MTRIILAIPLTLAACAPITCERVWLDPATGLYGCERPTGTLAPGTRGEGTDRTARPAVDRPESPRDHVTEPEPDGGSDGIHDHDDDGVEDEHGPTPLGPEPDRQTDPEEHEHWREQRDLYKEWGWK